MNALAEAARDHGLDPTVDALGFYVDGLSAKQAEKMRDGLSEMGIDSHRGLSH